MNKPPKDISVIIVSWNTAALLENCLISVLASFQDIRDAELIVVDNDSSDNSASLVEQKFPQVHLIKNDNNMGFSKANNQGIEASTGRYLLLLNSDTIVNQEMLPNLIKFMNEHPDAGACGVRLIRPDGTVQSFGFGNDPTLGYLIKRVLARLFLHRPLHNWSSDELIESDWVSGACLMLRSDVVHLTGMLDENLFMYFEDNDLCRRIRKAGWKVYYNPRISVIHIGGQSLAKHPEAQTAYNRSLQYFYKKHYGRLQQLMLKVLSLLHKFANPGAS
jgi:GT2 family glycosyltransferase